MKKAKSKTMAKNLTIKLNNLEYDLINRQARRKRLAKNKYVKTWLERLINKQPDDQALSKSNTSTNNEINSSNCENLRFLVYIFIFIKCLAKRYLATDSYKECHKSAEHYFKAIDSKRQA